MKNMEEDKTNAIRLNGYTGYSREEFIFIIDELFYNAGHLTSPKLIFESTMQPYMDFPGPVEVYVKGLRHVAGAEIEAGKKEELYEAGVFQNLKNRGKI